MFKALMGGLLNLLATVIQIICLPLNAVIEATMPNLSDKILEVTNVINTLFDGITWALGIIPAPLIAAMLFIVTIEIAKHSIYIGTHTLLKVWEVLQKIKFW